MIGTMLRKKGLMAVAMLALAACGAPIEDGPRPAVGALPTNCQAVLWTRDRECYRLDVYRCAGGPSDRVYFVETSPSEELFFEERRAYGLMPWASAQTGQPWVVADPQRSHLPDAAALLAGQPTTSYEHYPLSDGQTSTYDTRFDPAATDGRIDGEAVRIFRGSGTYREGDNGANPMTVNVVYVERAGVFLDGYVNFTGLDGNAVDLTPTEISFNGPVRGRCAPRQ